MQVVQRPWLQRSRSPGPGTQPLLHWCRPREVQEGATPKGLGARRERQDMSGTYKAAVEQDVSTWCGQGGGILSSRLSLDSIAKHLGHSLLLPIILRHPLSPLPIIGRFFSSPSTAKDKHLTSSSSCWPLFEQPSFPVSELSSGSGASPAALI